MVCAKGEMSFWLEMLVNSKGMNMNDPDIIPELKHCQAEFDEASIKKDVAALKRIYKREGIQWMVRDEHGNYIPENLDDNCN